MTKKLTVRQTEDVVPTEVLAASIVAISAGIKKLRSGRLNDRALFLLIQHASDPVKKGKYSKSPPSIGTIKAVLDGIEGLEKMYLRKPGTLGRAVKG